MGRRRSDIDAELQALYDRIPPMKDCKGLCWISCSPIDMSARERQRIRDAGFRITPYAEAKAQREEYWCEALGPDGLCQVYEQRPLVCRLWGAVEAMKCPYGCRPEGGFLSAEEGRELIAESFEIGGSTDVTPHFEAMRQVARQPGVSRLLGEIEDRGIRGDQARRMRHGTVLPEAVRKRKKRKTAG